ncbi:MAG: hypothetical protein ACI8XZ_005443 [Gammaproteobacteria bacterium]|jgi:hypothetical protein
MVPMLALCALIVLAQGPAVALLIQTLFQLDAAIEAVPRESSIVSENPVEPFKIADRLM